MSLEFIPAPAPGTPPPDPESLHLRTPHRGSLVGVALACVFYLDARHLAVLHRPAEHGNGDEYCPRAAKRLNLSPFH